MGMGVNVAVAVAVAVVVLVPVDVGEKVTVAVADGVAVHAEIDVLVSVTGAEVGCVRTGVDVDPGLLVAVTVGGKYTNVFVGLIATMAVLVACTAVVGEGAEVRVTMGNGVPVTNDAPGVRNTSIQLGCVKMEASIASINPSGLLVRKSLFGSSCESILVLSCQCREKRSASRPAASTHRKPMIKMIRTTIQSFRPRSTTFII